MAKRAVERTKIESHIVPVEEARDYCLSPKGLALSFCLHTRRARTRKKERPEPVSFSSLLRVCLTYSLVVRTRPHERSSKKSGELSAIKPTTFRTTLPQKAERNDALFDLWRKTCCAMMAPGQPQAKPRRINVFSGTRRRPAIAADLSIAYVMKHTTLAAKYKPTTQFGTRHSMATTRKTRRKAAMAK